jgi:hypothetical protein
MEGRTDQEATAMIEPTLDGWRPSLTAGRRMRGDFLGLRRCGLTVEQAGNLTAHLRGIHAVPGGWTLDEVARLQFTRWLVASRTLGADDQAPDPADVPVATLAA